MKPGDSGFRLLLIHEIILENCIKLNIFETNKDINQPFYIDIKLIFAT
ncbi:hypothetical protein METP3_03367 [Methanosarcinales archaeon]|nr:hypothetical protein METP3_03367 [Methanosarcinales archaeon]